MHMSYPARFLKTRVTSAAEHTRYSVLLLLVTKICEIKSTVRKSDLVFFTLIRIPIMTASNDLSEREFTSLHWSRLFYEPNLNLVDSLGLEFDKSSWKMSAKTPKVLEVSHWTLKLRLRLQYATISGHLKFVFEENSGRVPPPNSFRGWWWGGERGRVNDTRERRKSSLM